VSSFSLSKAERLSGRKHIETLFRNGKAFFHGSLQCIYLYQARTNSAPARVMFIAPKKKFKKAVQRNKMKRLCFEAYRQQKHSLYHLLETKEEQLHLALIVKQDQNISLQKLMEELPILFQKMI